MKRTLLTLVLAFLVVVSPLRAGSWEDVAAKVSKSIGQVTIMEDGDVKGYCTAFSINDAKDYFLTADHCLGQYLTVDGMNAYPIWSDPEADLLLLVVPDSGEGKYPALKMASAMPVQGAPAAGLGYGYAIFGSTFMAGYVVQPDSTAVLEPYGNKQHYTLTNIVIPGMSGGPIFNDKGELISVVQLGDDKIGIGRTLDEIKALTGKFWEK